MNFNDNKMNAIILIHAYHFSQCNKKAKNGKVCNGNYSSSGPNYKMVDL